MYNILSFGGGVQTTYMLLSEPERYDDVVFADPGAEWPETYAYIETIIKPFCQKHGLKFTTVVGNKRGHTSLEELCLSQKILPSRQHRWCTYDFKKRPIREYVKTLNLKRSEVMMAIGFSWDEVERMNDAKKSKLYLTEYPLLDKKITRKQCIEGIKALGFPTPRKSGCYYCPFQRLEYWKELYHNHKPLFNRAMTMEENSHGFKTYTLASKPLRKLAIALGEGSQKLEAFMDHDETCTTGYCMS